MVKIHAHHSYGTYIPKGTAALFGVETEKLRANRACRHATIRLYRTLGKHSQTGWNATFYKMGQFFRWIFLFGQTDWKVTRRELTRVSYNRMEEKLTKKLTKAFCKVLDQPIQPGSPEEEKILKYNPSKIITKSGEGYLRINFNDPNSAADLATLSHRCRWLARSMLKALPLERDVDAAMRDFVELNRFVEKKSPKLFRPDGTVRTAVEIDYKNKYFYWNSRWKSFFMKEISFTPADADRKWYQKQRTEGKVKSGGLVTLDCQPVPHPKPTLFAVAIKQNEEKVLRTMAKCLGFTNFNYIPSALRKSIEV